MGRGELFRDTWVSGFNHYPDTLIVTVTVFWGDGATPTVERIVVPPGPNPDARWQRSLAGYREPFKAWLPATVIVSFDKPALAFVALWNDTPYSKGATYGYYMQSPCKE